MNKYVKIGIIGAVIGGMIGVGYHIEKYHREDSLIIRPASKCIEINMDNNSKTDIAEENPYKLVKTNKTMA